MAFLACLPVAIPVPKFESGAVSFLVFDARFGSKADIWTGVTDVRFTPKCPPSA